MASTTLEDEQEYFDSDKVLDEKVTKMAKLVQKSKHCVIFTGAGISTECGIKDFRSGADTVTNCGAGAWVLDRAKLEGKDLQEAEKEKNIQTTAMVAAVPAVTHMSIFQLCDKGIVKFIISQNCDGLHLKSGINKQQISELHGNSFLEVCRECNAQYLRDFEVLRPMIHETGRKCTVPGCKGALFDTIINFGENLSEIELNAAATNAETGDLCLAMGSSLTVNPAASFAKSFGTDKNKDLIIINLQKTPMDDVASIRIWGKVDDAMRLLMQKLDLEIPKWSLKRNIVVNVDKKQCKVNAIDVKFNNIPCSIFKAVVFKVGDTMQFVGDSKWLKTVKEAYKKTMEKTKEEELLELEKAIRKCHKSLKKYAKKYANILYENGYHDVDDLERFDMTNAAEILTSEVGANNFDRRMIVEKYCKPLLKPVNDYFHYVVFEYDAISSATNANEDGNEDEKEEKVNHDGDYIEFEFAGHHFEKRLAMNWGKYFGDNKTKYQFELNLDLDTRDWKVAEIKSQ
eukprot:431081_1